MQLHSAILYTVIGMNLRGSETSKHASLEKIDTRWLLRPHLLGYYRVYMYMYCNMYMEGDMYMLPEKSQHSIRWSLIHV